MPMCPRCSHVWATGPRSPKRPKAPPPAISIYCACGAEWHGKYAVDNEVVIGSHRYRESRGLGCRLTVNDRRETSNIPRLQHREAHS